MDSVSAFVGIAEGQFPAAERDLCDSLVMEAPGEPCPNGGRACAAHAKGSESDESAAAPCVERHHGRQRYGNSGCYSGWGNGSNQARRLVRSACSQLTGDGSKVFGRRLSRGALICFAKLWPPIAFIR